MQFLYPSEADTHRLLRFLLDQLSQAPTTLGKGRSSGRRGRAGRIGEFGNTKFSASVRQALSLCWDEAHNSAPSGDGKEGRFEGQNPGTRFSDLSGGDEAVTSWRIPFRTCPLRVSSAKGANKKQSPLITIQAKPRAFLVPSVLELNSRNAEKSVRLADAQLAHLGRQAGKSSGSSLVPGTKVVSHGILRQSEQTVSTLQDPESSSAVDSVERSSSTVAEEKNQLEAPAAKRQAKIYRFETELATLSVRAKKV
jgi:hypothetical protein